MIKQLSCVVVLASVLTLSQDVAANPAQPRYSETIYAEQGWSANDREDFYGTDQGARSFAPPFEFLLHVEQPLDEPGAGGKKYWFSGQPNQPFWQRDYLERFGLIFPDGPNPMHLPIGFIRAKDHPDKNVHNLGFTCAACHTSQMVYDDKRILVDGGSGILSIQDLNHAMKLSFEQTLADPARLKRFADKAFRKIPDPNIRLIRAAGVIGQIVPNIPVASMSSGFGRIDALTGIRNLVFARYTEKPGNLLAPNAPVNIPHLWFTPWFDWVQWDGSIMQPMIRNAGEALGVGAPTDLKYGHRQYSTAGNLDALHTLESKIAGKNHPLKSNQFTGLLAPEWPKQFGKLDEKKAKKGEKLYHRNCAHCHGPSMKDRPDAFWSEDNWRSIEKDGPRYYHASIVDNGYMGVDSAQSEVLAGTVDLTGTGIEGDVCIIKDGAKITVSVKPEKDQNMGAALGLVVGKVADRYYAIHQKTPAEQEEMNGYRPNCLQVGAGYKARPLNGIWATAPFLHNGSVPNLYEMLLPADERSPVVYLGHQGFDPQKVGYISTESDGLTPDQLKGLTRVVTSGPGALKGDLNSGHQFSNRRGKGVIGPEFTDEERWQLVEYLKSL